MNEPFVITESLNELNTKGFRRISAAIGVFDGVHLGHQQVLKELFEVSRQTDSTPVVITFNPHPRSILCPRNAPPLLYPQEEKARLIHKFGAGALIRIPFTKEFAALSPDEFLDQCLHADRLELKGVCVGSRWKFGAGATGDKETILRRAQSDGFLFRPVKEVLFENHIVSSTAIRKALAEGDLRRVTGMLGRNYALFGTVVHGMGLAGKVLHAATANLEMETGVLPPFGVYATFTRIENSGELHPSITSIGIAPTIRKEQHPNPKVEIHLLDGAPDLYGKNISVELLANLRGEMKFDSLNDLKTQIHNDIAAAKELLKGA